MRMACLCLGSSIAAVVARVTALSSWYAIAYEVRVLQRGALQGLRGREPRQGRWAVLQTVGVCIVSSVCAAYTTVMKSFAFACKPWYPHRARSITTFAAWLDSAAPAEGEKVILKVHPSDLATAATLFLHEWYRSSIADCSSTNMVVTGQLPT